MSSYHNLKKLKVTLEYRNATVNMEMEPYRLIKDIKARAFKIFFPINCEIKLIYGKRDITPFDNISIGDFFKNKHVVTLKVVPNLNKSLPLSKNELTPELESNYDDPYILKSEKNLVICPCGNDFLSYYCRTCQQFLCKTCRMNYEHKYHSVIHIELDHLEESVKLYAITLQSEISSNIKSGSDYVQKFQTKNFIDTSSRQEIINRKLISVENKFKELLLSISPKDDEKSNEDDRIKNLISEYNSNSKVTHMEIEKFLEEFYLNYTKRKKRLNFSQCKTYFDMISSKEKELENGSLEVSRFKLNYEIYHKIDEMYDRIEKAIDEVLDQENIFGLEGDNLKLIQQLKKKKEAKMQKLEIPNPNKRPSFVKETTTHEKYIMDIPDSKVSIPHRAKIATNNPAFFNRIVIEAIDKTSEQKSIVHLDDQPNDSINKIPNEEDNKDLVIQEQDVLEKKEHILYDVNYPVEHDHESKKLEEDPPHIPSYQEYHERQDHLNDNLNNEAINTMSGPRKLDNQGNLPNENTTNASKIKEIHDNFDDIEEIDAL